MSSDLQSVHTDAAPAAVGPYSQAMRAGSMLFCSGQVPLDPQTGKLVEGGIEAQTRQVFANLSAVLEAGGCSFSDVAAAQVFVTDLGDFAAVNTIYAEFFGEHRPARATVEVSALPVGASVEISCTAIVAES